MTALQGVMSGWGGGGQLHVTVLKHGEIWVVEVRFGGEVVRSGGMDGVKAVKGGGCEGIRDNFVLQDKTKHH